MLIFLLLRASTAFAEICYNSIGNQDPDLVVCDPNAESSACCSPGDLCYSNGLCQPGPEQPNKGLTSYYVDGCTDPSWNSPVCMAKCLNVTGNGVEPCGINQYCCFGFGGCDCSESAEIISIAAGVVITTIPMTTSTTSTSYSSTNAAASFRSSAESLRSTKTTSTSILSGFTTVTTSPTAATFNSSSSASSNLSTGAKAGIGVGVGLVGVLAFLGLSYFLVAWRRRTRPSNNFQDQFKTGYRQEMFASRNDESKGLAQRNLREPNPAELDT